MNAEDLAKSTGATRPAAERFLPHIEAAAAEFEINTPVRLAAFLAQVGHESGGLHWLREIWGPTIAQTHYEGRADLGNTEAGDGLVYRGRGLIQITGRANYREVGEALGVDLETNPDKLETAELATRSAAWFWKKHGLNELADGGDFALVTRRVNGGLNGYDERFALWERATEALA